MTSSIRSSNSKRDGFLVKPFSNKKGRTGIRVSGGVPLTTWVLAKANALNRLVLPEALPPYTTAAGSSRIWYFPSRAKRSPCWRSRLAPIDKVTRLRKDIQFSIEKLTIISSAHRKKWFGRDNQDEIIDIGIFFLRIM